MRTNILCAVLSVAVAGFACESQKESAEDEVAEAPKAKEAPSAEAEKAQPEPPKTLEGEALANFYVGCWNLNNEKKWDEFQNCYDEKATSSTANSDRPDLSGREAIIESGSKEFTTAFTDAKGAPEIVLVNGREIAAVALLTGTHDGPMKGPDGNAIPATNKKLGQHIFHTVTVDAKNQVTQETIVQDEGTLMTQLGLSEGPGRAAEVAPLAGSPNIIVAKNDATEKANVDLVKKAWEDVQKEDLAALESIYADDVVEADQCDPENLTGKQAVSNGNKQFFAAMGDIKAECPSVWGAGAYVVAQCKLQATNDGDMGKQFKKTGKSIDVNVVEVSKVEDGKIKEVWRFMNGAAMARQLGLIATPEPGKVAENAEAANPAPAAAAPPAGAPKEQPAAGAPKDQPASAPAQK